VEEAECAKHRECGGKGSGTLLYGAIMQDIQHCASVYTPNLTVEKV
jgi:hypothetical protein